MFYSQPLSTRFGTNLIALLEAETWTTLDIAVAWVRASGIAHLESALSVFLKRGNEVRITVGIDLDNTTKEGLASLLDLKQYGKITIFVHHNEAGTIFHPKLYLFENASQAKLIVGSNNITEAGLYQNTEAGLEIDAPNSNQVIVSTKDALESWRDTKLGLSRELDATFLDELVANGYVPDEATARAQAAARRAAAAPKNAGLKKLFGRVAVTPPARPLKTVAKAAAARAPKKPSTTKAIATTAPSATGQVLLMRVRKARGTQVQIPLAVMRAPFFSGATEVVSASSNVTRGIHETHTERAKSKNPNTLKLELPETRSMTNPVARFERTPTGIQYEVYDAASPKGKAIMNALKLGLSATPPTTSLTVPSNPDSATWWCFI